MHFSLVQKMVSNFILQSLKISKLRNFQTVFFSFIYQKFKGQLISKTNCQAVNSSKKRTNKFVFTSMRRIFVCFLEEIEDSKKAFRNYLTFSVLQGIFEAIKK